jgi:hypothetical protein
MAIGMKSISNYDYLRYMIAASREISDEPNFSLKNISFCTHDLLRLFVTVQHSWLTFLLLIITTIEP